MSILLLLAGGNSGTGGLTSPQFFGDEAEQWVDDGFEPTIVPSGFQQSDINPQIEDGWDWQTQDDDDQAPLDDLEQTDNNPVICVEDAWDWSNDDAFDHSGISIPSGFQQSDVEQQIEDAWQHWDFEQSDDEYVVSEDYPNPSTIQYFGDEAEVADQDDDEQVDLAPYALIDHNPLITLEDAWDHFPTDEDDYVASDDFLNDVGLGVEDAWDHFAWEQVEDDYWVSDDALGADSNPLIDVDDGFDWQSHEDDDYESAAGDALGADNNPLLAVEDGYDHFAQDEDDYPISDDYLPSDPAADFANPSFEWSDADDVDQHFELIEPVLSADNNPLIAADDPWDYWPTEDDEFASADDLALAAVTSPQYGGDDAELLDSDDDEQPVIDDFQNIPATIQPLQYFGEDAETEDLDQDDDEWLTRDESNVELASLSQTFDDPWDHFSADDDDQIVTDENQTTGPAAQYFGEDAELADQEDDEQSFLDESTQAVIAPIVVEDGWDWFSQDDDDQPALDEVPFVSNVLLGIEDAWDHFPTDDDDYAASDDVQNANASLSNLYGIGLSALLSAGEIVSAVALSGIGLSAFLSITDENGAEPANLYGLGLTLTMSYGSMVGKSPIHRQFPHGPAWLGFRTASGGGVW